MTIDEAIAHCLEVAEQNEFETRIYDELNRQGDEEYRNNHCQCAADHRQLAEWLKDYKELEAKHWDECRQIAHYDDELKEAKRLLKLALQDMNGNNICDEENACNACKYGSCVICSAFEWKYTNEALKLIGGSENG